MKIEVEKKEGMEANQAMIVSRSKKGNTLMGLVGSK